MLIKAQKEIVSAKLLANPRVLVLDNEKAQIKIVTEIPYQELIESSGGGSVGTTSFREIGVALEVIFHVICDDMVRLHVFPEFSVQAGEVQVGTATNQFPQPTVDRRTVESILLLKSGQTMVLGGLRKKEVNQQKNKIPLLGDISFAGNLFKFEAEEIVVSELVVFITPLIVENPALTENEKRIYEVTDFEGPCPGKSKAEETKECMW